MNELTEQTPVHCANCGAILQGEFCHHCGQSVHSVLKPVHHMVEDTMDMVLHVDSRIVHTLPPLLFRPGFLTREYFAGRRQRYVAPFRLMFVLALLAFFVSHLAVGDHLHLSSGNTPVVDTQAIDQAPTAAAVDRVLGDELAGLRTARRVAPVPGAAARLDRVEKELRRAATARKRELGISPPDSEAAPRSPLPSPATVAPHTTIGPVQVDWLPAAANRWLTRTLRHASANLQEMTGTGERAVQAREQFTSRAFAALPQTMLVLLPLFALLLKAVYLFRRRLYMEHLIVALHSHAFLFLALLLYVLLGLLEAWLAAHLAWAASPVGWLAVALAWWVPVYLLLMQKRIYGQGWPMTLAKFLLVGCCYVFLLSIVLAGGVVWTLAH